MADARTLKQRLHARLEALKSERSAWVDEWQQISAFIAPDRGRFTRSERGSRKRTRKILNERATQDLNTLASGMAAGLTTPSQPWFKLTAEDQDLAESGAVRVWLEAAETLVAKVLAKSNFYQSVTSLYKEMGAFGTGALWHDEDFETVSRFYPFSIGEFALANDERGRATTCYRELELTVEQTVARFGLANVSQAVRNLYDGGSYDRWVPVVHAVEPYGPRFADRKDARRWAWVSVYYEPGGEGDRLLSLKGYDDCPVHAPRWDLVLPDAYGTGPGHLALASVKDLQALERRISQAVDHKVHPALQGPPSLQAPDRLPGSYNPVAAGQGQRIEPLYDQRAFSIQEALLRQQATEQRIDRSFYADLFLMLAMSDRRQITAREIEERHEEKLLQLGPVLTRLNDELLNGVIDRVFGIAVRASQPFWARGEAGMLPPPPPELEGRDLKVEYLSALQQAARAVGVLGVQRLAAFVGEVSQFDPTARYKLDTHQAIDDVAERLGVSARIVRPDEDVAAMLEQDAAQAQAAQAAQMAQVGADAAAKLGRAQMQGTALGALAGNANG